MTQNNTGVVDGYFPLAGRASTPSLHPASATFLPPSTGMKGEDVVEKLQSRLAADVRTDGRCVAMIWGTGDEAFKTATDIFNGAIKTTALALVQPVDAEDVSKTIVFCREHSLELSVKAGGTGVHGWSLAGDVIIDLALMTDIAISLPDPFAPTLQESFERLTLRRSSSSSSVPVSSQRPSLCEPQASSSGSGSSSTKRTADVAWNGDTDMDCPDAERKVKHQGLGRRQSSPSGSSCGEGDLEMSRSSSRNGTSSGSGSHDGGSTSTFATSSFGSPDGLPKPTGMLDGAPPLVSPATLSIDPPQSRTTYVNPSPTATSCSYPFVSTNFSVASSSSSYSTNVEQTYLASASGLKLNTHPDPPSHTLVTFGAGTHSKQLDAATAASQYGAFHVPTSAYPVGSGQFLAGGFGFIGRKHGLAMDNIVEAELVLADGRIVWVGEGGKHGGDWKEDEDPEEVWWGLRGAGASLSVVTRFRAKAYYLPSVYAGNLIYMFDRTTTRSLFRHVRDCVKGAPRSMYCNVIMTAGPSGAAAIVIIQLCFSGSRAEGELYIQAINSWDGGRCMFQDFSERTFERQQVAVEEVLKGGTGKNWYIKSDMLKNMTDDVIDQTCDRFSLVPRGCTWLFEYTGGGALADVKDSCFGKSHRDSAFTVAALHQWGGNGDDPDIDALCVANAEKWIDEVIHTESPGGPLPSFMESATSEAVSGIFKENHPRLMRLKDRMDPTDFFRHGFLSRSATANERRQLGDDGPSVERVEEMKRSDPQGVDDKGKGRQQMHDTIANLTNGALDAAKAGSGVMPTLMKAGAPEAASELPDKQTGIDAVHRVSTGDGGFT